MSSPTASAIRQSPRPGWASHLVGIEGLRGAAALAVLLYHVRSLSAASTKPLEPLKMISFFDQGLTLFFVLSGFLLFAPFARSLLEGRALPKPGRYLGNRLLRVFPAYIVVLLSTSLLLRMAWMPREVNGADRSFGMLSFGDTLLNLVLLQGLFPRSIRSGLEVAWTLGVEVSFYLVLPLLAFAAALVASRLTSRIVAAALPAIALLVTGVVGKAWLASAQAEFPVEARNNIEWGANWHSVLARSILVHGDLFAYGMLAAVAFALVVSAVQSGRVELRRVNRLRIPVAVLAILALTFAYSPVVGVFDSTFVAVACAALLLLVVTPTASGRPSLTGRLFSLRIFAWFGTISFGIYLWHLPLLRWLDAHHLLFADSVWGLVGNLVLIIGLSSAFAAVTYHQIEVRALKLKHRRPASG